jgi:hypothetical protein
MGVLTFLLFQLTTVATTGSRITVRVLAGQEDPSGGPDEAIIISRLYPGDIEGANRAMKMLIETGNHLSYFRSYLPYLKDFPIEKTQFNELQESMGLPGFDRESGYSVDP